MKKSHDLIGKSHRQLERENNDNSPGDSSGATGTPTDLKKLPEEHSSVVDRSDVAQTFAGLHKLHVAFKLDTFPHENFVDVDVDENALPPITSILQEDKLLPVNNNTEANANPLHCVNPPDEDSSSPLNIKPVESEDLPLIQSPLVTTPPYEYLVLPKTNESKFRIYLNPRVNENFHQAVLKQLTNPSSKKHEDVPASDHHLRPMSNQHHSQQLPSGGSIATCFDPSEIDMDLKQILIVHPPVTNTIVRKRPRKERGSSVPAIDSYYGCEDLEKVGHASYFIPLLTPSERKSLGWKDDYKYGKWKYSTPNFPKVTSGPIPLSSRHSTILKSTSSWWKRSVQQLSRPIVPSATSVAASHQASHAFIVPFLKSTEDTTTDEEDALLENASLATLAGSEAEPLSHFKRRIQLSKLFRWFIPDCLKSRTNKSFVRTWNEGDPSFQGSTRTSESSMMDGQRRQEETSEKVQVKSEESTTSGELNSVHLISHASHTSHKRKKKWGKICGRAKAKSVHRQPYRRLLLGCVGFSSADEVEGGDIPESTNGECVQDTKEEACKENVLETETEKLETNDNKDKAIQKTTTDEASPVLELETLTYAESSSTSLPAKRQCPDEDDAADDDTPEIKIPRMDSPDIPDSPASPDRSHTEPAYPNLNYGPPKVIPIDRVDSAEAGDDSFLKLSDPESPSNVNYDSSESTSDEPGDNSNGPYLVLSSVIIMSKSCRHSVD